MAHTVRVPVDLADAWRKAKGPLHVGDAIEHAGRIYIATRFNICPYGTDVWTQKHEAIIGTYRRYIPEEVTAEELIEMHEFVKQWQRL